MDTRFLKALRLATTGVGTVVAIGSASVAMLEHAEFESAVKTDSLAAMERFLQRHPIGEFSEQVLMALHDRLSVYEDAVMVAGNAYGHSRSSSSGGSSSGTSSSSGSSSGAPTPGNSGFGHSSGNSNGLGHPNGSSSGNPYH